MSSTRAVAYARYSSDNQRDESIDAQLRAIEDYARKNGFVIVRSYVDRAKSATSDKRPEFQQMVRDSDLGLFNAVLVHKLDRFSRDKYDHAHYKRKLSKNGVRVISVLENLDESPESLILESVLEGMSAYYSQNLAREVRKGMRETALQCKHTGGTPPLGFDVGPDRTYVVNKTEAEAVRTIFQLYHDGWGYDRIIGFLNERGWKTKAGGAFGKNSLHDILTNQKYAGVYVFNRSAPKDAFGQRNTHASKAGAEMIRVEGGVPEIVPVELFARVQAKMEANKRQPGRYKAKAVYLLSGLIFCGECSHAMQGNFRHGGRNKLPYATYRCGNREQTKGCRNFEVRKEYLEEFVLSELERQFFTPRAVTRLVKAINDFRLKSVSQKDKEIEHLQSQLAEVDKQIVNIVAAISQGFMQATFRDKLDSLEHEKAQLDVRLSQLRRVESWQELNKEQLQEFLGGFRSQVAARDLVQCKTFLDRFVSRVAVWKDRAEVVFHLKLDEATAPDVIQLGATIDKESLLKIGAN